MYKTAEYTQISFFDFNQSAGLQLDPTNEWVLRANLIPWQTIETAYAKQFPSEIGNVAKPARMVLGALIIKQRKKLSDRALVAELTENPYLQFFIGLHTFNTEAPFHPSVLVDFRKRMNAPFMMEVNEQVLMALEKEEPLPSPSTDATEIPNVGTTILDATCAPSNIRYPKDTSLLSEAREKLEAMIDWFHKTYSFVKKPRTYRRIAHRESLAFAKMRKPSKQKVRAMIRKQLGYVLRDLGYIEQYMMDGYAMNPKFINPFLVIKELYRQQKYMFDEKSHKVPNRIVSLSQPFLRPIVRGKAKAQTEFGAKFDVSIDTKGFARIEKLSFDAYNEGTILQNVVENFKQRTGAYPERVLVDQIYRTRDNRAFCKAHGIRMSGPKLGRPSNDPVDKKIERQDNVDRIEIERFFSLSKRCNGLGLIVTKLPETTFASIALSVLVTNLFAIPTDSFFIFYFIPEMTGNLSFDEIMVDQ